MSEGIEGLIMHWNGFDVNGMGERFHPEDESALANARKAAPSSTTVETFLAEHMRESSRFHLSLAPVPFVGDLRHADIFLLMINPSLSYSDYGTDSKKEFRTVLSQTLKQEFNNTLHPCFALDPALWWSSWSVYYERLFRRTLWDHAKDRKISYGEAITNLSQRLAILELVPYYSSNAGGISDSFLDSLKSAEKVRAAAQDLVARAEKKTATVIVKWKRNSDRWAIGKSEDIVRLESRNGFKDARERIVIRLRSERSSYVETTAPKNENTR